MPHAQAITRQRLLHDRKVLLAIVRDCRSGKASHLAEEERHALIDHAKRRIAELDQRLKGMVD